jgi:hypothetical protein
MPCSGGENSIYGDARQYGSYDSGAEQRGYNRGYEAGRSENSRSTESASSLSEKAELRRQLSKSEAAVCAICNELESRGILKEVLEKAGTDGQIDLMSIWKSHSNEDEVRLNEKLKEFSTHERNLLKKLL